MTAVSSVTGAFRFYLKHPQIAVYGVSRWAAATLFAAIVSTLLLPSGMMEDVMETGPGPLVRNLPSVLAAAALLLLSALLTEAYFAAATYRFIKTRSVAGAYAEAFSVAPKMLGVTVLKTLIIAVLAALAAGLAYAAVTAYVVAFNTPLGQESVGEDMARRAMYGVTGNYAALAVLAGAALAFTLAAAWVLVKLMFMGYLVSSGGMGVMESFRGSRLHLNGYFRKALLSVILFGLAVSLLVMPTYLFTIALGGPGSYVQGFLASMFSPLSEIFAVSLYIDIKKRREADDSKFTVAYKSSIPVSKL